MSEKSSAANEHSRWLDGIGLSGTSGIETRFDEIPGFVNSAVFGKFSLDDLDFGDDPTKGRIDFDDEYLLKAPAPGAGMFSEGNFKAFKPQATAQQYSVDRSHSHAHETVQPARAAESWPERDSSGGYYHPAHGSGSSRAASKTTSGRNTARSTSRRQMPEGRSVQENVFDEITGFAREAGMKPEFLDNLKSLFDKAPTEKQLKKEAKSADRMRKTQSIEQAWDAELARREQVQKVGNSGTRQSADRTRTAAVRSEKRQRAKGRLTPGLLILIFLALVRFMSFAYQKTTEHFTAPKPDIETSGGGFSAEAAWDEWREAYMQVHALRNYNDQIDFTEMSMDETAEYLGDCGWDVTINEGDEDTPHIEAMKVLDESFAQILVAADYVTFELNWDEDSSMSEDEMRAMWENILEDETVMPGIPADESIITPEMLQAVRDNGDVSEYGSVTEYTFTEEEDLFLEVFDIDGMSWDAYFSADNGDMMSLSTDADGEYICRVYVSGDLNENF